MTNFIKTFLLPFFLLGVSLQTVSASCWVRNASGKWYYFKTLCCHTFIIHPELGEDCYNIPGSCWGAFTDETTQENLSMTPEGVPSLSFLKEINQYSIEIKPDGSGEIYVDGVKAVTLTAEGLADFFKQSPAVFYESAERKTTTNDAAVLLDESGEKIGTLAPGQSSAGNVVPLGKLDEQQVGMIKRLSEAGKKAPVEKYQFSIAPNPSATQTTVNVTLSKKSSGTLYVVDIFGVIKNQSQQLLEPGANQIKIDLQSYTPGTYMILLDMGDSAVSGSFIKY